MSGPARPHDQSAPLVNRANPWPGLAAFSEEHAEFFHGREREVEDLFRRVRFNALSVLYGQSGLGKTSLVQAALFPRLRQAGLVPVSIRIDYSPGAPTARLQICQAIGDAMDAAGGSAARIEEHESLWEYFHRERPAAAGPGGKPAVIVLAFDQFEEAFTLGADRDDGRGFVRDLVEELGSLAEDRPPSRVEGAFEHDAGLVARYDFDRQDYRILLSLREDFLAHLHDLAARIPSITVNNMRLTPLDGARALEVVERPGHDLVAPGAAQAIVRFVADAGDERREGTSRKEGDGASRETGRPIETLEVDPSLLCLFCRELNEKRGSGLITPALVAASREKILSEFYDRALSDQHPGVRLFVEDDLLTAKGFRQTLSVDSAEEKLKEYGAPPEAVSVLVNRRLLHFEQRGRQKRVELTHDILTRVVRESRSERHAKEAEEERRREAEEAERRAQAARAATEAQLEQARKRQRVTRALLGVVAVAAGAAIWFGIMAGSAARSSQRMLTEFCSYALQVINRFGDSTSGRPDLTNAYNALIELSDTSVHQIRGMDPDGACPWQLEARTEIAAANTQAELGHAAVAQERAIRALAATHHLAAYTDLASQWETIRAYSDIAYLLWRFRAYDSAAAAARAGIRHSQSSDEEDIDRFARMYHYGALSLIEMAGRARDDSARRAELLAEARAMVTAGAELIDRALAQDHPEADPLRFSLSQLWMRRGEVDTSLADTAAALASYRTAVSVARQYHDSLRTVSSRWWRGISHRSMGRLATNLRSFDEAAAAYDSAMVDWVIYRNRSRELRLSRNVELGAENVAGILLGMARIAIGRGQPDRAVGLIHHSVDSAEADYRRDVTPGLSRSLSKALTDAADLLEEIGRRNEADAYYVGWIRNDSVRLADADIPQMGDAQNLDRAYERLATVLRRRALADTAGKSQPEATEILRTAEVRVNGSRQGQVWVRRFMVRIVTEDLQGMTDTARVRALTDSVATALGNLGWSDLILGRGARAVENSREALDLSERDQPDGSVQMDSAHTYILPNLFNGLVMSGETGAADSLFTAHASRMVEAPAVPFPCAVVRDARALYRLGALNRPDLDFVQRLAAASIAPCQNLPPPPTP
jgi:hypothetical protein